MAELASGGRKRSSILLIAVLAAVVVVGVFVAGFLVGGASTSPSATPTTTPTPTTTTLPCTSTCIGFTSSSSATVVAGSRFSFTVTTTATGAPVTKIKKVGALPKGVHFRNNHNGTATLGRYTDIDQDEVGGWHLLLGLRRQSGEGQNEAGRDTGVYLDRPGLKPLTGASLASWRATTHPRAGAPPPSTTSPAHSVRLDRRCTRPR